MMYIFSAFFAAFLILVLFKRGKLGLINNRFYMFLAIASIAWWIFLVIDGLNTDLQCTPDDSLCNSGNTFWGDVGWGSMLAVFSLLLVWSFALLIGQLVRMVLFELSQKSKKK